MATYLLRRIGFILLTLLLASLIIFAATQLLPGDVAQVTLGQFATKEAVENLREQLGLNRPVIVQYVDWLTKFVSGNWGDSMVSHQPVLPMIMSRLRNSAMLGALALVFYVPLGIFLGAALPASWPRIPPTPSFSSVEPLTWMVRRSAAA